MQLNVKKTLLRLNPVPSNIPKISPQPPYTHPKSHVLLYQTDDHPRSRIAKMAARSCSARAARGGEGRANKAAAEKPASSGGAWHQRVGEPRALDNADASASAGFLIRIAKRRGRPARQPLSIAAAARHSHGRLLAADPLSVFLRRRSSWGFN